MNSLCIEKYKGLDILTLRETEKNIELPINYYCNEHMIFIETEEGLEYAMLKEDLKKNDYLDDLKEKWKKVTGIYLTDSEEE